MGQAAAQGIPKIAADVGEKGNFLVSMYQNDRAADDLTARQNEANALYRGLYDTTSQQYQPYVEGGSAAYDKLLATYGIGVDGGRADYSGFMDSPDYQFARDQGINALDRSAAARGRLYSGAQMKGLAGYASGLATQNLDRYRQGLFNTAGMGLQGTNALTNYRAGYGNQLGQGITNLGDIAAAERLGIASINDRYNQRMQSIWLGGGSSSFGPQNQNAPNQGGGGQSSYGQQGGNWNWGSNGYNYGSTADNFNWGGGGRG